MKTEYVKINPKDIPEQALERAGEILRAGGLVAFPTETVYGLGGDAENPEAARRIYAAKGRPSDNPLIVHIADFSQLEAICDRVPETAEKLADAFWPGPLTMIVKKNGRIPTETTGGLDTAAVRFPSHPVARALIRVSGCMIAAPSANTSGRPSPTKAIHVREDLDGKIDMIIDGGEVRIGLESTIVDLTDEVPTILRPGYISRSDLEQVIGEVRMDPGILEEHPGVRPKAPGMRYKHYAPKGDLAVVEGGRQQVVETINRLVREDAARGEHTAVLASDETAALYHAEHVFHMGSRAGEDEIAARLYDVLRQCDEMHMTKMYSENFDTPRIGQAIMNRLLKAAGHHVITAEGDAEHEENR